MIAKLLAFIENIFHIKAGRLVYGNAERKVQAIFFCEFEAYTFVNDLCFLDRDGGIQDKNPEIVTFLLFGKTAYGVEWEVN